LSLTQDQIEKLFEKKTEEAISGARRNIDNFDKLPKDIQLVVVDMIYNLGVTGFFKFDDVVSALKKKDYKTMAKAMWYSNWRKQVGSRAEKLVGMVQKQGGIREDFEEVFSSIPI
jgi:lysozyme